MSDSRIPKSQCGSCGCELTIETGTSEVQGIACPNCGAQVAFSAAVVESQTLDWESEPVFFVFSCPNCVSDIKVERHVIGKTTTCRECEQTVRVPGPSVGVPESSGYLPKCRSCEGAGVVRRFDGDRDVEDVCPACDPAKPRFIDPILHRILLMQIFVIVVMVLPGLDCVILVVAKYLLELFGMNPRDWLAVAFFAILIPAELIYCYLAFGTCAKCPACSAAMETVRKPPARFSSQWYSGVDYICRRCGRKDVE